jgi:hypothetical protein
MSHAPNGANKEFEISRPRLSEPSTPPHISAGHPLADFYRPTSACSSSPGDCGLPAIAAAARYL